MGALSGRRILLVEDEALIALDLQNMLDRRGATVIGPAASVSEALDAINANQIDCALLNIKLGDETTHAVVATLEQRAIPMVFVTAYSDARLPPGFETHPIIQKPYSEDQLLRLIDSVFDRLDT
jgi:two-component SAPR family response regulator